VTERHYLGATFPDATYTQYTDADLSGWTGAAGRKAGSTLLEYSYDGKGRLSQETSYTSVDASGNGLPDYANQFVRYTYDAQGLLRQQVTVRGTTRTVTGAAPAGSEVIDFCYDGMGRLLGKYVHDIATSGSDDPSCVATTYAYTDSGNRVVVTLDSGATTTQTFNAAHRLLTSVDSGLVNAVSVTRTTKNYYDAAGQLRATKDATLAISYFFYDAKGALIGQVDGTGAVIEYKRDGLGRVVDTIAYATRVDTSGWMVSEKLVIPSVEVNSTTTWNTNFDSLPIAGLDTTQVNDAANSNVLTLSGGRLVFDVNSTSTEMFPSVIRSGTHALTENISYSAEVTTGATQDNTFLLFFLESGQQGTAAYRRQGVYFNNGLITLQSYVGTVGTQTQIGTTQANTTYVVETRTRNGRIENVVYAKGQDPSTGWTFGVDAKAADWTAIRLQIAGHGGVGLAGDALYLDNLREFVSTTVEKFRPVQHLTFDSSGALGWDTSAVNNPSNGGVLTTSGGRLVFDVNSTATAVYPAIVRSAPNFAGRRHELFGRGFDGSHAERHLPDLVSGIGNNKHRWIPTHERRIQQRQSPAAESCRHHGHFRQ
jgi:YD repeat-containing protein